jgi:two-component system, NtrC family, sensor kinase
MPISFTTASLATAIIGVGLGIFVYFKNTKSVVNRTWLALSISVSVWCFGIFCMHNSTDRAHALFWIHFLYVGALFIPPFFLHFVFSISDKKYSFRYKWALFLTYFISIIFSFFNFFTSLFVKGVQSKLSFKYYTDPGILFPFFSLFFLIVAVYSHYELIKTIPHVSGVKRNQLKYVTVASIFGFGGGVSIFLPIFNIKIYPFGHFFVFLYPIVISYAIIRHQLLDINIVIKKGMVYAYLSFFVLVPCMIAIIFAQHYFFGRTNIYFSFLAFCTLLLASLVFLKVTPEIEEYVEKRLFKRKFEYKKALRDLSEIIISFLDEKELFKKTGNILTKDLGAEKVSFFLLDKEKKAYTLRSSQNMLRSKVKELPMQDLFLKWLEEKKRTVVREVLERSMDDPDIRLVIKRLESMESEVCIPLMSRDHLIGIINLGHKRSGDMYSHEDLDLLTHFAAQASIALENARLYQEMQRTQQLMRRSDRMASLGSLTAGLAHEIRNPLVAVKTFLDLLPERYKDKEFRVDFLKLTSSELDRITNLVSELLNFAKPTKPKFRKTDVNQVIEEIIPLIQVEATKRDIAIETNLLETPKAMLDADQMKQVFLNIFLNAIEAIKDHGRISITSRDIQKNGSEYVQVEIADTGKGIPKRIMEQIFDPFFTTKEKGAGLGLAITHQIVQDHHGTIEVESMPKKGTTFFINIPC